MTIAQTIASQIGNKALFMIGAKHLMAGASSLQMRIGRNSKGWNVIKIILNGMDTYDMIFYRINKANIADCKTVNGIYNDQLCEIIESETGLRTSL